MTFYQGSWTRQASPGWPSRIGKSWKMCSAARSNTAPSPPSRHEDVMKTQGEIEAAISDGIARFEQEYLGRGPQDIHAHLIGDLLVVRLRGVLTVAEQQLVRALSP